MSDVLGPRVYKFEDSFMLAAMHSRAPLAVLQGLADSATRRWRVPPVDVKFSRSSRWSGMYFGDEGVIRLYAPTKKSKKKRRSGRNPHVLLHEVAHHIDDWRVDANASDAHGPAFLAIVMDLYDHFHVLPKPAFRLLAKKHRLEIARGVHPKMRKRASAKRGDGKRWRGVRWGF